MSILVFQCFHYTYVHLQFPSLNNTDIKTFVVNDRLCFLKTKQIRGGIRRREEKRGEAKGGRENKDSYCRKRSTETESECERGD